MPVVAVTSKDAISINGRNLNDFADGDVAVITYPNDLGVIKTGKNGNSIISYNYQGKNCEMVLRLVRGTGDDKFMNGLLSSWNNNPAGFVLMISQFVKNVGDGAGNITQDISLCQGGVFKKQVEVKENAEGETDQAVSIYTLIFSNVDRSIG